MIFYDCLTAPSPRRARILLHEKQVPHEVINIDLRQGEQLSAEYKLISPSCTVPALKLDDGTVLTENSGIAAYLESAYPNPPMLGTTDAEKGLVANWNARIEFEGLYAIAEALRNSAPMLKGRAITGANNYDQIPELAKRGMQRANVFFDTLNERLEGREFVAIDGFSNADIAAVVAVDFAYIIKIEPQAHHENIIRWRKSLADRPSLAV